MRILFWSNAPFTTTGYGRQLNQIIPRFQQDGHVIGVVANYGLAGNRLNYNGVEIFPLRELRQNADVISSYVKKFGADIVISLYDVWALPHNTKELLGVPWVCMVPIDGGPIPYTVTQRLANADYIVSYSRYGQRELMKVGIESTFIPHGIDLSIFKPVQPELKDKLRSEIAVPDNVYLITVVAANKGFPPRKSWPELLAAYKIFHANHPESLLYMHTSKMPLGSQGQGMFLEEYIEDGLGMSMKSFALPDEDSYKLGIPDAGMAKIYQSSDMFLLPSRGEGFGLPLLEAQACGCPIICGHNSAQIELCVNGLTVPPLQPQWLSHLKYYWQIPSINDINAKMEEVFNWNENTRQLMAIKGREHSRRYDINTVYEEYWTPFIQEVEATLW